MGLQPGRGHVPLSRARRLHSQPGAPVRGCGRREEAADTPIRKPAPLFQLRTSSGSRPDAVRCTARSADMCSLAGRARRQIGLWPRLPLDDLLEVVTAVDLEDAAVRVVRVMHHLALAVNHSMRNPSRGSPDGDVELRQLLDWMAFNVLSGKAMDLFQPLINPSAPFVAAEHILERRHHPERQIEERGIGSCKTVAIMDAVRHPQLALLHGCHRCSWATGRVYRAICGRCPARTAWQRRAGKWP